MRNKQIIVRLSEEEKNLIKTGADFAGMGMSEFIRYMTMGVKPGENDSRRRAKDEE